jgi:hypothetical protein
MTIMLDKIHHEGYVRRIWDSVDLNTTVLQTIVAVAYVERAIQHVVPCRCHREPDSGHMAIKVYSVMLVPRLERVASDFIEASDFTIWVIYTTPYCKEVERATGCLFDTMTFVIS